MADKTSPEWIRIVNTRTGKEKPILKSVFMGFPIGKDGTRNGYVEKDKMAVADVRHLIPKELQSSANAGVVHNLAMEVAAEATIKAKAEAAAELEKLKSSLAQVTDERDALKSRIESEGAAAGEMEKLGKFLMENYSTFIREGSAADAAITVIGNLQAMVDESGKGKKGGGK